jgi:hypothetical protein
MQRYRCAICLVCGAQTEQTFFIHATHAGWTCAECSAPQDVKSLEACERDWEQWLAASTAHEPPFEVASVHAAHYQVYVAHHLGEAEVSPQTLQQHLRITGKLPSVGEPLMILPGKYSHKACAIPYGKVVRIVRIVRIDSKS